MSEPHAILIAGPTASGKSAHALAVARDTHSVIINADSMQVYSDLRLLSARPTVADESEIPHALYGHVDGAETYSVARWLTDVTGGIETAQAAGQLPIITGGTGLYFKALLAGLSPVPDIPSDVRQKWRTFGEQGLSLIHI